MKLGTENVREREQTAYHRPHQPTHAGDQHPRAKHSLQPGLKRGWGALRLQTYIDIGVTPHLSNSP